MAERFVVVHKQSDGLAAQTKILVDTATGVSYLWHRDGYAGGLTALVDKDGKPVITNVTK